MCVQFFNSLNLLCSQYIYWLQGGRYPTWQSLARDYLVIMASSVSSERAFSSAGITITKWCNRLDGDIVEALQFLKSMIHQDLMLRDFLTVAEEENKLDFLDGQPSNQDNQLILWMLGKIYIGKGYLTMMVMMLPLAALTQTLLIYQAHNFRIVSIDQVVGCFVRRGGSTVHLGCWAPSRLMYYSTSIHSNLLKHMSRGLEAAQAKNI